MNGGVASPSVDHCTGKIYWIASYDIPGSAPSASAYGYVLEPRQSLAICGDYKYLQGQCYRGDTLINRWYVKECCNGTDKYRLECAQNDIPTSLYDVYIDVVNNTATIWLRKGGSNLSPSLVSIRFINKSAYLLTLCTQGSIGSTTVLMELCC